MSWVNSNWSTVKKAMAKNRILAKISKKIVVDQSEWTQAHFVANLVFYLLIPSLFFLALFNRVTTSWHQVHAGTGFGGWPDLGKCTDNRKKWLKFWPKREWSKQSQILDQKMPNRSIWPNFPGQCSVRNGGHWSAGTVHTTALPEDRVQDGIWRGGGGWGGRTQTVQSEERMKEYYSWNKDMCTVQNKLSCVVGIL